MRTAARFDRRSFFRSSIDPTIDNRDAESKPARRNTLGAALPLALPGRPGGDGFGYSLRRLRMAASI